MPRAELIERWRAEVPETFCFAIKAPRRITHIARLKNTGEEVAYLDRVISGSLGPRLGPILFQLPPFLKKDSELLEAFLAELPKTMKPAFEFRHVSWFDEETYGILRRAGAALVGGDVDEGPSPPLVATADFGYLRLRAASYDAEGLAAWSERIASQPWQTAYVYLKHEYLGPMYAKKLIDPERDPARSASAGPELDDRVHRHRRGVLERIADRVADDGRGVQRRALLLQLDLDDLLGVVPRAAGVGHEDGLEQAEDRDRDQVADEEERLEEREGEGREEDAMKMLNMPFCAYCVQISTTFLRVLDVDALVAPSSLMLP